MKFSTTLPAALVLTMSLVTPTLAVTDDMETRMLITLDAHRKDDAPQLLNLSKQGRKARGARPASNGRLLKKSKSKSKGKGTIDTCCDFIKQLVALDNACFEALQAFEIPLVCEQYDDFEEDTSSSKGKGDTEEDRIDAYEEAVEEYEDFIEGTTDGDLLDEVDNPANCYSETPITFGFWCESDFYEIFEDTNGDFQIGETDPGTSEITELYTL